MKVYLVLKHQAGQQDKVVGVRSSEINAAKLRDELDQAVRGKKWPDPEFTYHGYESWEVDGHEDFKTSSEAPRQQSDQSQVMDNLIQMLDLDQEIRSQNLLSVLHDLPPEELTTLRTRVLDYGSVRYRDGGKAAIDNIFPNGTRVFPSGG